MECPTFGKWTPQVLLTPNISYEQQLKRIFFLLWSSPKVLLPRLASLHSSHLMSLCDIFSSQTHQGKLSAHPPPPLKKKQRILHASLIIDTSNGLQLTSPGAQSSPWFLPQSAPGWVTLVLNELPLWHSLKKDYVVLIATYNMQGICHLNESINGMNVQ